MIEKNCKITLKKAVNGYIAQLNDNGEPYVFANEDQLVEWFKAVVTAKGDGTIKPASGYREWKS